MMGEIGESSGAKPTDQVWAKLVPSDLRYSDIEIRSDESLVCSEINYESCDKRNWCKIIRNADLCSATVENNSASTMIVDEITVRSGDMIVISNGSEIVPGPDRGGFLSFRFNLMPDTATCQKQIKICFDTEHAKCSICLNVWHDAVTVAPCLHNFCNGCFSEWLRRCQEKHSSVLCPQCRAAVQFVGRNHFLHNIAEDVLKADSSLRRSNEEITLLDSYASIRSNLVIQSGKKHQKKRRQLSFDELSDGLDLSCPQCGNEFGGFHCNQSTVHLQCQSCGGMMPSRSGLSVPQHCLGCDRAFCGAYWHILGVTRSDSYPLCSCDTFQPISEHSISRIPVSAHERNQHEQNITESCIREMGRTLQGVIAEWIAKLNNREIDRTRMPLNHAEMITSQTYTCIACYEKLVSFLLYCFRISIPNYRLPPDASRRENCWYGYSCQTQHHNEEHARKRNHVCRPTRGFNM